MISDGDADDGHQDCSRAAERLFADQHIRRIPDIPTDATSTSSAPVLSSIGVAAQPAMAPLSGPRSQTINEAYTSTTFQRTLDASGAQLPLGDQAMITSTISKVGSSPIRLHSRLRLGRIVNRSNLFQNIAFVFCILFGLALIACTHTAEEGSWFWYSFFLDGGKRLYADMHMVLQPLVALETNAFMAVLGKGWLVSKIPAAINVVAYCLALLLLVRQSNLSDARKAIVLACSFFVSISAVAYQFADVRALADCFVLYSVLALLSLRTSSSVRRTLGLVAILGALSALTLTTRPNDGCALLVGVLLAIVCLAPSKRLLSLLLFCLATGLTLLLIVSLTGDSLHDYAKYSIFKAAGSKGGAGSVLTQPLLQAWSRFESLINVSPLAVISTCIVSALIWAFLIRPFTRSGGWWGLGLAVLGVVLIAYLADPVYRLYREFGPLKIVVFFTFLYSPLVLLAYGLGIWVVARFIFWLFDPKRANGWDRREILLLIPLGLMASGSMSSSGQYFGDFRSVGIFIVLLAICCPIHLKGERPRDTLFALAVFLILCTATYRFNDPFDWLTYVEKPMSADRTWYRHPDYGPMIIDRDLLQMIQPVCGKIRDSGSDNELLSLPFSYANYFCSIPPWHGYVTTFFDISTEQTIQSLMDELQRSPPKWVFYQRQLRVLRLCEIAYNHGNPLPQRYLEQLIEQKISDGKWRVVYTSDFGDDQHLQWDNQWMLIQTR
jgi:hypothetical protein